LGSNYKEIDKNKIKLSSIEKRDSLIKVEEISELPSELKVFQLYLNALPDTGKSAQFRRLIDISIKAINDKKPLIIGMGAHLVKLGLSGWINRLIERGVITHIAMNGAVAIHDVEMALFGETSEDVEKNLKDGSFGMCKETGDFFNRSFEYGIRNKIGSGEALGVQLGEEKAEFKDNSIFYNSLRMKVPASLHIAIGTDIVHQHPEADGSAIGDTSMRDFRIFAESVRKFIKGGVFINFGSAVIIPEVFLKALSLAFNIDGYSTDFTTANFDQIQHYRPTKNILQRPGGEHFAFTGHHEFLIPLFCGVVLYRLGREEG
jgi:hypothetical protein